MEKFEGLYGGFVCGLFRDDGEGVLLYRVLFIQTFNFILKNVINKTLRS